MLKVFVIHENDAWVEPLRAAFAHLGTPYEEWFLDDGVLDGSAGEMCRRDVHGRAGAGGACERTGRGL